MEMEYLATGPPLRRTCRFFPSSGQNHTSRPILAAHTPTHWRMARLSGPV